MDDERASGGIGGRFDRLVVEDAPPEVIDAILARFRASSATPAGPGLAVRVAARIRAALTFDDWNAGPTLALRGVPAVQSGPRHLVYSVVAPAIASQVAISLYPLDGDRVTIIGQLLSATGTLAGFGQRAAEVMVEVMAGGVPVAVTTCSATGEFVLDAPSDWDEIVVVGPDADILIDAAVDVTGTARP